MTRLSSPSGFSATSRRHTLRPFLKPLICAALLLVSAGVRVRADQVEMQNGDRYTGSVLSLNATTLVLKNDVLGTLRLPRAKVVQITLGAVPVAPPAKPAAATTTNAPASAKGAVNDGNLELSLMLRQLSANTNLIRQVQEQFLSAAGPEANSKFNELVGGLANGTISVGDLRAQAKTAADQLRAMKKDLGEDTGWALDGYLSILDNFLSETAPTPAPSANTPIRTAAPALQSQPKR